MCACCVVDLSEGGGDAVGRSREEDHGSAVVLDHVPALVGVVLGLGEERGGGRAGEVASAILLSGESGFGAQARHLDGTSGCRTEAEAPVRGYARGGPADPHSGIL